jgi:hypothetical protein
MKCCFKWNSHRLNSRAGTCGVLVPVVNVAGRELGRCLALLLITIQPQGSRTLFLFTCCPLRAFYAAVHSARRSFYLPVVICRLSEVVVARTDTLARVRYPRRAQLGSYASSDLPPQRFAHALPLLELTCSHLQLLAPSRPPSPCAVAFDLQ